MEVLSFETDKFNLTIEGEDFINPNCFGEDFANWLKPKLEKKEILVSDIYQEDWGWELVCSYSEQTYYLGVGGLTENKNSNHGEWRVMFTKKRNFMNTILGNKKLTQKENIILIVKSILEEETAFSSIRFEKKV